MKTKNIIALLVFGLVFAGYIFPQSLITITVAEFNAGIKQQQSEQTIFSRVNGVNYSVDKATRTRYSRWDGSKWVRVDVGTQRETDFEHTVNNRQVTITGYRGSMINVVIPATINGMPVVAIGEEAFRAPGMINDLGLTSVIIPDSVKTIGRRAFENNNGLTRLIIGNGVTDIGGSAFNGCYLDSIDIPNSVTTIGPGAFAYNRATTISIPDSVTSLGTSFWYSSQLVSASVGTGVTGNIGHAFVWCSNLTAVNIAAGNPALSSVDGVVYSKDRSRLVFWPIGKRPINIPSSVTTIGLRSINTSDLSSITIPNNVRTIDGTGSYGDSAIDGGKLTSITIGENVTLNGVAIGQNFTGSVVKMGFEDAYNNGGRRAGTYTRPNTDSTTWTRQ